MRPTLLLRYLVLLQLRLRQGRQPRGRGVSSREVDSAAFDVVVISVFVGSFHDILFDAVNVDVTAVTAGEPTIRRAGRQRDTGVTTQLRRRGACVHRLVQFRDGRGGTTAQRRGRKWINRLEMRGQRGTVPRRGALNVNVFVGFFSIA